ncbi:hypothetical protein DFJ73DRAFT_557409 [Zopfochytrium polystomum]|nr:hypothetical protein DFJ73DRAFT_557409 [Zopfochytrium polystomum]
MAEVCQVGPFFGFFLGQSRPRSRQAHERAMSAPDPAGGPSLSGPPSAGPQPAASDRLTQIQDCVGKLSELLYTAIGVLQRDAPLVALNNSIPITAWTEEQTKKNEAAVSVLSSEISTDIVQTCKVIDFLIDKLPGVGLTEDEQLDNLAQLERESDLVGDEMERGILEADDACRNQEDHKVHFRHNQLDLMAYDWSQ